MNADERQASEARLEVLDALCTAQDRFADVAAAIAGAQDEEAATDAVVRLLHLPQRFLGTAVLDMQLRRRTADDQHRLRAERDQLRLALSGE
jgi:DNA gyrase/topoisomerase IV subunit A